MSNLAPVFLSEEFCIDVAGDNEAEHEQAHHNHYLLLHNGQTEGDISGGGAVPSGGGGARPLTGSCWRRRPRSPAPAPAGTLGS